MATVNRRRVPAAPSIGGRVLRVTLVLVVLALTFGGGLLTGRHLERRAAARVIHDPDAPGDATNGTAARARGRTTASDPALPRIQEKLTFYQTLTAPLTGGPPDARQGPTGRAVSGKPEAKPVTPPPPRPAPVTPAPPAGSTSTPEARADAAAGYTIQVAAYRTRAQAEALRAKLGAEAYVVEGVVDSAITFRVRLGAFGSRAEAEAARLERSLGGFITPR
jgi:cell division protein FtsN